jgi:hypothetical protein
MRSKKEIRKIVEGFTKSGMTRREYCAKQGLAMTTLDYWRRAQRSQKPKLVRVTVDETQAEPSGFALMLANGRRIESSWGFAEADLVRLIRAVEG